MEMKFPKKEDPFGTGSVKEQMRTMEADKEAAKHREENRIAQAIKQAVSQAIHNTKEQVLNSLYKEEPHSLNDSYSRADEFEKQQFKANHHKKEDELSQREFFTGYDMKIRSSFLGVQLME